MSGHDCVFCGHGADEHPTCIVYCTAFTPVSLSDAEATIPPVADPSAGTDPVDTPTSAGSTTVEAEQVGRAIADWALGVWTWPPFAVASMMERWTPDDWAYAAERAGVAPLSSAVQAHAIRLVREGRTPAPADDLAARIEAVGARHSRHADGIARHDTRAAMASAAYRLHRSIAAELRQALAGEA